MRACLCALPAMNGGNADVCTGCANNTEPINQEWFWSKEWQQGELEADRDIANGDTIGPFDNINDALQALRSVQ